MASTVLPNGIIIPEKFSRDWYADLYHNWEELDNLLGGGTPKDGTLTIQKNGTTIGTFSANQATDETIDITVPDVNNGTLTIQKNGTDIGTFSANQSTNETINITVPDVNDATLTIQKNGTTVDTFTANSSSDKTVNITVPTATSELTNDSGYITGVAWNDVSNKPTFATVATSGSYNDLSNKPTIPTVNDATLTIQKNGTTIDTFTANSSTNKTVNISVPTNTSELTNGAGFITADYAIPRSGGAVLTGADLGRVNNTGSLSLWGGTSHSDGAKIDLYGSGHSTYSGCVFIRTIDASNDIHQMVLKPDGTATWGSKNLAMQEDVIPRSGGAVLSGNSLARDTNTGNIDICGGTRYADGASIALRGSNSDILGEKGNALIHVQSLSESKTMILWPNGTWTWDGTACQITSDQRLKQQISNIDDKLLDAWEDVNLVQFKYNDAVDQKGKDKARLHTGYVVQQIQKACESHGVDVSAYGLYCHEEYPQETEEVEIEQADGTKTKERKVIREASEHYSLRYTEALIVECKYLRRCIERLTARIEELEKGNNK